MNLYCIGRYLPHDIHICLPHIKIYHLYVWQNFLVSKCKHHGSNVFSLPALGEFQHFACTRIYQYGSVIMSSCKGFLIYTYVFKIGHYTTFFNCLINGIFHNTPDYIISCLANYRHFALYLHQL